MKNIEINDLNTNGMALFSDSESYLRDLSEDELNVKGGGITAAIFTTALCVVGAAAIIIVGAAAASCNGRQKP